VNENSRAEKDRALEALAYLSFNKYYFYYKRLAFDNNGKPKKDTKGCYIKEVVRAVDVLFNVKEVRDEQTDKFKYYEITPSGIFLDQLDSYFLLVPAKWEEEIAKITGKKPKKNTLLFIIYLLQQFELKRREYESKHINGDKRYYEIKVKRETICQSIGMPESIYKRKKARAETILQECYDVALKAGYLKEYKKKGDLEIFIMDELKYPQPEAALIGHDVDIVESDVDKK
jgi:hypothetical protein